MYLDNFFKTFALFPMNIILMATCIMEMISAVRFKRFLRKRDRVRREVGHFILNVMGLKSIKLKPSFAKMCCFPGSGYDVFLTVF